MRRLADAVLGTGSDVVVTIQGNIGRSVMLQSTRAEVLKRTPADTGSYLPWRCQGDVPPRYFRLDLASPAPELAPYSDSSEPVTFSFRINDVEPDQFVITVFSPDEEVEWLLHIRWTSGATEGELVVDDRGKPFRTTGIRAARQFCLSEGSLLW